MNKVILIGRLTRDPEIRYSASDNTMAIAKFTIAVDRRGAKTTEGDSQQTADFIQCTAFRQTADFIGKYFKQGSKIVIVGRIQTGSYTNKDGQKVYTTDVIVEECEFAESKGHQNQNGNGFVKETSENNSNVSEGFMDISEALMDELPFN